MAVSYKSDIDLAVELLARVARMIEPVRCDAPWLPGYTQRRAYQSAILDIRLGTLGASVFERVCGSGC